MHEMLEKVKIKGNLLSSTARIPLESFVDSAVKVLKKIEDEIKEEEHEEWDLWSNRIGLPSLEDMAHHGDDKAIEAIDLLGELEDHAIKLKKMVDVTFKECTALKKLFRD